MTDISKILCASLVAGALSTSAALAAPPARECLVLVLQQHFPCSDD